MATIRGREDLEAWLRGQPAEVSATIASRVALRVLHVVSMDERLLGKGLTLEGVFLGCIRALIVAVAAAKHPSGEISKSAAAASRGTAHPPAASAETTWAAAIVSASDAAHVSSATYASTAVYSIAGSFASAAASAAAQAATTYTSQSVIWNSVQDDCDLFEGGTELWKVPLWPQGMPEWSHGGVQRMFVALASVGSHWRVFLDWYQDRLDGDEVAWRRGRPSIPEMDIEVATIPDEEWKKGAKHIFGLIRKIQERYWKNAAAPVLYDRGGAAQSPEFAPIQEPEAISFASTEDGMVDLAAVTDVGEMLLSNPSRQEDYTDLREKAEDIQALGANRVGDLLIPIQRLLALSDQLTLVRGALFWSKANTLRKIAEGHQAALGDTFDERRLDLAVGGLLVDLVETINVFMIGDPLLRELDAARPGPQEALLAREAVQSIEAALTELADSNIMTDEAGEVLSDEVTAAQTATDTLVGRQRSAFSARTVRNAVFAVVGSAVAAIKNEAKFGFREFRAGIYRSAGTAAGIAAGGLAVVWIAQFNVQLLAYAEMHVQSPALLDAIRYVLSSLP